MPGGITGVTLQFKKRLHFMIRINYGGESVTELKLTVRFVFPVGLQFQQNPRSPALQLSRENPSGMRLCSWVLETPFRHSQRHLSPVGGVGLLVGRAPTLMGDLRLAGVFDSLCEAIRYSH